MTARRALRVLFVAEGDAETFDCWSGCAFSFVTALRAQGHTVRTVNAELAGMARYIGAAVTWTPSRTRWRQRFILGPRTFRLRSAQAQARVAAAARDPWDVVVQVGATFSLGRRPANAPVHILYADANAALARAAGDYSEITRLDATELAQLFARERRIYDGVDGIWTFSEYAARSFTDGFDVAPDRICVLYAGPNEHAAARPTARRTADDPPRVLFVGRQHRRKGLDLVLEAFRGVRTVHPRAELHLLGVPDHVADEPGVHRHGLIRPDRPGGAEAIANIFASASIFCLPSRYEPFGVSFIEAMLAGLPCIGARNCAMPEIILDGETGWLVEDGRADQVQAALLAALADPAEAARRGANGRRRALELFSWERVAARAAADAAERLATSGR